MLLALAACSPDRGSSRAWSESAGIQTDVEGQWRILDPPAAPDSLAPNLSVVGDQLAATWLERQDRGNGMIGHRLQFSVLIDGEWQPPVTIVEDDGLFANWADIPALIEEPDGDLLAHWLARTGDETYAYSISLARSMDRGRSWRFLGQLNDDATLTEHGFVSWVEDAEVVRAFWLDGRAMLDGGAMSLRTSVVGDEVAPSEVLDERVCDCCSTAATLIGGEPLVVYRDRSEEEIRDIGVVRRQGQRWRAGSGVAADNWEIPGCPVNGPAAAVAGGDLFVVWFTAAGDRPRVQAAISRDQGASFGEPILIDGDAPLGRVDLVSAGEAGAFVSWLARGVDGARVMVGLLTSTGVLGDSLAVAQTQSSRASGFPRLERIADHLYLVWVDVAADRTSHLALAEIPVSLLSGAGSEPSTP